MQRLVASCRDVGSAGKDEQTGYGFIRPLHALTDSVPASAPNPVFAAYDKWKGGQANPGGNTNKTAEPSSPKKFNGAPFVFLIAAVVIIVLIFAIRRSGKRGGSVSPPPGGGYGQDPRRQGPPQSFGPGNPGAAAG